MILAIVNSAENRAVGEALIIRKPEDYVIYNFTEDANQAKNKFVMILGRKGIKRIS